MKARRSSGATRPQAGDGPVGSRAGAEGSAATKTGCASAEEWRAKRAAGLKWCSGCRSWLAVDAFAVDRSRGSGQSSVCRPCSNARTTRSRYRLTRGEHEAMLAAAAAGCPICGRLGEVMVVDHDHQTDIVRGYLCSRCNVGLGQFEDDPDLLQRAIAYLESHGAKRCSAS